MSTGDGVARSETPPHSSAQLLAKGEALRVRARVVSPCGMYGQQNAASLLPGSPQFLSRWQGCRIWDTDGNAYIDFIYRYGPIVLGHTYPVVGAAAAAGVGRLPERAGALPGRAGRAAGRDHAARGSAAQPMPGTLLDGGRTVAATMKRYSVAAAFDAKRTVGLRETIAKPARKRTLRWYLQRILVLHQQHAMRIYGR